MSRINRAIELLEKNQPVYYTSINESTHELTYDNGVQSAKTWADYLLVEMEHGAFNLGGLAEFMRGLVDGGPTKSGHRTPAIITTIPTDGTNGDVMRANAWMVKQVLAAGVHGVLLCHAEDLGAVKVFIEAARYAFHLDKNGNSVGRRGSGGQTRAATIWGVPPKRYLDLADVWPLNPEGEILLGVKIENKRALDALPDTLKEPGIAFAEWGPGDMGMSHGYKDAHDPPYPNEMEKARTRVKDACAENNIFFLNLVNKDDVREQIDEGVRICSAPNEEVAEIGRKHTNRRAVVGW